MRKSLEQVNFLKLVLILFLILVFCFAKNVKVSAKTNSGNFDQYEIYGISQLYMRNWSSYPSSGTDLTDSQISSISYPVNEIYGYATNSAYNIASQGFSISYSPNSRFLNGYLYSVQTVVCFVSPSTPNSVTFTSSTGTTAVNSYTRTPTYQVTGKLEVYDNYYTYGGNTHRCYLVIGLVVPSAEGAWYSLHITSSTSFTGNIVVWGTNVSELGLYSSSIQQIIENSISSSGLATASQIQQVQSAITNQTNTINSSINSAQSSINNNIDNMEDNILNSDYNGSTEQPNKSDYEDFKDKEDDILDAVQGADLDNIDIAIDEDSSSFVWDTMTSLLQSNSYVFGLMISILSIGILKLVLGR